MSVVVWFDSFITWGGGVVGVKGISVVHKNKAKDNSRTFESIL